MSDAGSSFWLWLILVFIFIPSSSAEQKNITAESGQNITLTCGATNSISGPKAVVEWSRTDLGSEYVLLYRDEHFDPDNQHPSFKKRVDLQDSQMEDGDASLILKDVTINDTGTYQCRVSMGTKRRKRANLSGDPISSITLSVVAPPGQAAGRSKDGGEEDGRIVGLSVCAVLLLLLGVAGLVFWRKCRKRRGPDPKQPADEQQLDSLECGLQTRKEKTADESSALIFTPLDESSVSD